MRKVSTSRFGEIEVDEKKIIHFKNGIPAFEDEHEFIILPTKRIAPITSCNRLIRRIWLSC
jgi:flagellar assembly factor FliW